MADNSGVYPLDPTSEVGKLRILIGDTVSTPFNPAVPGFQNYLMFSDIELEGFIAQGGTTLRSAGFAYLALAAQAALTSSSVKDYDLQVDNTKRAADLRAMAQFYFDQADVEDAGSEEGFEIVPTGRLNSWVVPELAARPFPWC